MAGLVLGALAALALPVRAEETFRIATGELGGVYFPLGGAICRLYNLNAADDQAHCAHDRSEGSVANLEALRAGTASFVIVQSDVLRAAVVGEDAFAGRPPLVQLRPVLAAHGEPLTLVVAPGSTIRDIDDLAGQRIAVGGMGSGDRLTAMRLFGALGWSEASFASLASLSPAERVGAVCAGQAEGALFQVGHPSGYVQDVTYHCGGVIVPVIGPAVEKLVRDRPEYDDVEIPAGVYPNNPTAVRSFGPRALLVTTEGESSSRVGAVLSAVFDDFDLFRRLHPAFAALEARTMVPVAAGAPLHPEAERFFRERGLP
jgi:hypothetical protein